MNGWKPGALILGMGVLLSACDDHPVQPAGEDAAVDELEQLPKGIHPVVSIPGLELWSPGQELTIRIHLKAVDVEAPLQSYQGEIRFDPELLAVQGAGFPDGLMGAWHAAIPGRLRFAGITLDDVGLRAALELTVLPTRRPVATDFQVVMEEIVGTGADRPFRELTADVVTREAPLFTTQRLDITPVRDP